jgi:outer membrane receptor protein involved in Fe transport
VAVDALERSLSVGYSLSYASERSAVTASLSSSKIDNLAYIDFDAARPRLLNSDETARVDTFDIELSHQVSEHWTIGGGGELFEYDRAYRDTFGVVPVEERLRLFGDYAGHGWKAFAQLTWVGSRDLTRYGTGEHYNVLNPDGTVSDPKDMVAPSYVTLDARIEKSISEHMAIYLGGTNLTDFDQAGDEESPLMYDAEGGYDVVHIWGPLRGRVLYAGLKMDF